MNETNNQTFDLGSALAEEFDPFVNDDGFADDIPETPITTTVVTGAVQQPAASATQMPASVEKVEKLDESDNPIESAISTAETKDAQKAQLSLY